MSYALQWWPWPLLPLLPEFPFPPELPLLEPPLLPELLPPDPPLPPELLPPLELPLPPELLPLEPLLPPPEEAPPDELLEELFPPEELPVEPPLAMRSAPVVIALSIELPRARAPAAMLALITASKSAYSAAEPPTSSRTNFKIIFSDAPQHANTVRGRSANGQSLFTARPELERNYKVLFTGAR